MTAERFHRLTGLDVTVEPRQGPRGSRGFEAVAIDGAKRYSGASYYHSQAIYEAYRDWVRRTRQAFVAPRPHRKRQQPGATHPGNQFADAGKKVRSGGSRIAD